MPTLHIVSGDDEFAVKSRARTLAAELCGDAPDADERLEIVEGSSDAGRKADQILSEFLDAIRTPPFLTETKVVRLKQFAFLAEWIDAAADKKESLYRSAAEQLLKPLPEGISAVIDGPGLDQRKSFVKKLRETGAAIEVFNSLKSNDKNFAQDRRTAIQAWSRRNGRAVAPDAAAWLAEVLGGDSGSLSNELDKLAAYAGDGATITLADCRAICSRTPEAVAWNFTGALVERNTRGALELLDTLLEQGDDPLRVMAMIANEYQRMIQVRLAMAELGITRPSPGAFDGLPSDAKTRFPKNPLVGIHPFRAFKLCESAARFADAELARALKLILEANRSLVSGGGESRLVLERLIFSLTAPRPR